MGPVASMRCCWSMVKERLAELPAAFLDPAALPASRSSYHPSSNTRRAAGLAGFLIYAANIAKLPAFIEADRYRRRNDDSDEPPSDGGARL